MPTSTTPRLLTFGLKKLNAGIDGNNTLACQTNGKMMATQIFLIYQRQEMDVLPIFSLHQTLRILLDLGQCFYLRMCITVLKIAPHLSHKSWFMPVNMAFQIRSLTGKWSTIFYTCSYMETIFSSGLSCKSIMNLHTLRHLSSNWTIFGPQERKSDF